MSYEEEGQTGFATHHLQAKMAANTMATADQIIASVRELAPEIEVQRPKVVRTVYDAGGGSSVYEANGIMRCFATSLRPRNTSKFSR